MNQALKHDSEKVRMELLSVPALVEISRVMTFGAKKYADHNWRQGFAWSRLYGAALRHLSAHMNGENTDAESGLSHLAHAGCCIMFLIEHEARQLGTDDRYVGATEATFALTPASEVDVRSSAEFGCIYHPEMY